MTGKVSAICIAASAGAALHAVGAARLQAGRGIPGDRYFKNAGTFSKKLARSQDWEITLIELEEIERFNASMGESLEPGAFRRNIITTGVRLNELVGRQFSIGAAVLSGVRLCEPCAYLAKKISREVVSAMAHRAGLRARIVSGGEIRAGDVIEPIASRRSAQMQIEFDNPQHCSEFVRLNEIWITEHFALEEADRRLAEDPLRIVREGGHIICVVDDGKVVGVCALFRESPQRFQLARMAVDPDQRGKGYGRILIEAAIAKAEEAGARSLYLLSNTKLAPAIALYQKHGFTVLTAGPHPQYARCNVIMERLI